MGEDIEMVDRGDGERNTRPENQTLVERNSEGRWKRLNKAGAKTKQFLTDETKNKQQRALMAQRRMAYLNKFGGKKTESPQSVEIADGVGPTRRRRDAAHVVLFKAAKQKITAKPMVKPTWQSFGGRSFLTSDWKKGAESDGEDAMDMNFFFARNVRQMRDEVFKIGDFRSQEHSPGTFVSFFIPLLNAQNHR